MSSTAQRPARKSSLLRSIVELAGIVLAVFVAKAAIAEPFYVPSGSMEPTLLIGDELLATKYPYGYGTASLPAFLVLPDTAHVFSALPKRGDVVVFRWPGDRSQVWVKRVIGLPGDRIALRNGQVWINGQAAALQPDGTGHAENEDGTLAPAARLIETLPGGRKHTVIVGADTSAALRAARQHGGDCRCARSPVRHGRQPRQLRRQPRAAARGRRRPAAG